jgi:hypothetical protein
MLIGLLRWKSIGDKSCGRLYSGHLATYLFSVTGQGWVAFSFFPLINTRVGRMKKRDDLQETFERTLKSFFKRTKERENEGERKT